MRDRTMAKKFERARVQAREASVIEFTVGCYLTQPSKPELRAMVVSFDGVIPRGSYQVVWRATLKLHCTRGGMGAAAPCRFLSCCSNNRNSVRFLGRTRHAPGGTTLWSAGPNLTHSGQFRRLVAALPAADLGRR
jgi:hypothetical protein